VKPGETFHPFKLFNGVFVPLALLKYPDLSWFAKLLWARLAMYAGTKDFCFVRLESLAKEMGVHVATVGRGLKELCDLGLIRRKRRGPSRENLYTFIWHSLLECSLKRPKRSKQPAADCAEMRSHDSAEMRSQEPTAGRTDCAEMRGLIAHFCSSDRAEMRGAYKEEETPEETPLKDSSLSRTVRVNRAAAETKKREKNFRDEEPQNGRGGLDHLPVAAWANRLYARHPRKKDKARVLPALMAALRKASDPPALFAEIDRVHALWCASREWASRKLAPWALARWLDDDGWTALPLDRR